MYIKSFLKSLETLKISFFTGVPDSQLAPLCDYLMENFGLSDKHMIAVNEGNALALAAGYHLSTGKTPCVYLQNSGLGNLINPLASLTSERVYGIPSVFVIGWRGEPGIKDEPQHMYQGEITPKTLDLMGVEYFILSKDTSDEELDIKIHKFKSLLEQGKSVAFLVKKGGLVYDRKAVYKNNNKEKREDLVEAILEAAGENIIVSTTGKTSREVFELREKNNQSHKYDFLTVGSMGHSSAIALGIALNKPNTKIWCIDGDGAALMHMGSLALIGSKSPKNFVHVLINNGAHESVGGQPTVGETIDFCKIAKACAYKHVFKLESKDELKKILEEIKDKEGPFFIELKAAIGSRENLGRPTTTPLENKEAFMAYLKECN
ncbi:MAG: phosphonopyruvate decarboxylase [Clostridiales bacterium]|nr:phosphonopyruvate decarboxylase [Clostridiales bacterium]